MQYDPIKQKLGAFFNKAPFLRILFYKLLDLLLLRTWHVKKELKKWKKQYHFEKPDILDAGSGFGQYTYYVSTMFDDYSIKAIDVKEEQIEDCNRFFRKINKPEVVFELGDLTTYKEDNAYDLVLCVDVLEHIEEDVKVMSNFYQSLKENGTLIISTPSDQGGSDVHHEHEASFIDEHVRDGYGIREIEDKLKQAGFSKVYPRYTYGRPGKISWKLSMKYPITLLNTSKLFYILLPFYYLVAYPVSFIFNKFDVMLHHKTGTGLMVKAVK